MNIKDMYYYVTQNKNGKVTLLGYNLTHEQKEELFYSFLSADGKHKGSTQGNISNGYGTHKQRYTTEKQAIKELIDKPKEFNDALKIIEKYGFVVYPKHSKTVSYQQAHKDIF